MTRRGVEDPTEGTSRPELRARARRRVLVTRRSLARELRALGVRPGAVLLVHASLSSLGFVCGGAVAVVQALRDAVGARGTVVVPTHTSAVSDPAAWRHPPVPRRWWTTIRREMPAFDPRLTPAAAMGRIPETLRRVPGAVRSSHPMCSFAAVGRRARALVARHPLSQPFGPSSPLGRLVELGAHVLLLGVGHESNSSLHLAEVLWGGLQSREQGAPVLQRGRRVWRTWIEPAHDEGDFGAIGASFDATGHVRIGSVGAARARLMPLRGLVAHARAWMHSHRSPHPRREAAGTRERTRRGRRAGRARVQGDLGREVRSSTRRRSPRRDA